MTPLLLLIALVSGLAGVAMGVIGTVYLDDVRHR